MRAKIRFRAVCSIVGVMLLTVAGCTPPADSDPGSPDPTPNATATGTPDAPQPADPKTPGTPEAPGGGAAPRVETPYRGDLAPLLERLRGAETRDAAAGEVLSGGAALVPELAQALESSDWQTRSAAGFALGLLTSKAEAALPALRNVAENDENEAARDAAAFAIAAIEEADVDGPTDGEEN